MNISFSMYVIKRIPLKWARLYSTLWFIDHLTMILNWYCYLIMHIYKNPSHFDQFSRLKVGFIKNIERQKLLKYHTLYSYDYEIGFYGLNIYFSPWHSLMERGLLKYFFQKMHWVKENVLPAVYYIKSGWKQHCY